MRKLAVAACVMALSGIAFAADAVKSGLPVGANVPAFNVRDITGPNKGKTLCYRCKYGAQPVVTIFTRTMNDGVKELVKSIDEQVAKNQDQKMAAFVVLLTENPDQAEPMLEKFASEANIKNTPLTVIEGAAGPPNYKLSKDAEVTVMMWVESEVKVNEAFAKGQFDKNHAKKLAGETGKILQ